MSHQLPDFSKVAEQAARAGGAELLKWRGKFASREKQPADLVTDADFASQAAVQQVIREHYPDHHFVGEEDQVRNPLPTDGFYWVVDPLDGTTNYVHGFPFYCVSIAVAYENEILAGVIYNPLSNECFRAAQGTGSFCNDAPIRVSQTTALSESLLAVSFPPRVTNESPDLRSFQEVAGRCRAVRRTGSCALNLAYVASGALDAFWAHSIHPWDVAAGILLVCEAGGTVTGADGKPFKLSAAHFTAAACPELHAELLPFVRGQR